MDLSKMSLKEMRDLEMLIGLELRTRESMEINLARQQIAEIAKKAGINLLELIGKKPKAEPKEKGAPRYVHHKDDGTSKVNTDLKVPAMDACLRYVASGNWVEIDADRNPIVGIDPRDIPLTTADHW